VGRDEAVKTRACSNIDDAFTHDQWTKRKRVGHSSERLNGRIRQGIDDTRRIAEARCEGSAGMEMESSMWIGGDLAVFLLHLLPEGLSVYG